jgi:pyrimidine operon attenuation protein/uracil phosphoribosyltransferase
MQMSEPTRELLMDERAVQRALARMAREIVEHSQGVSGLVLIGVQRRGVQLAARLGDEIERAESVRPAVGTLDITLYRDDLTTVGPRPVLGETRLPPDGIDQKRVVIVDDVCYTGRTVRAALDELADFGRPARILLCVLIDRGGRELPIHPDIVGRRISTLPNQLVEVRVPEVDGRLGVELLTRIDARE